MFAATEPDIFKQTSRHFPAVFLRTKLDMFVEMSGHIPGTKGEVNFHMNVVKLKVKYEMLQSRSMRYQTVEKLVRVRVIIQFHLLIST